MARSRKTGGGRQTKATSRKRSSAPAVQVEVVEEASGMGISDGLVLGTSLILVLAIILTDMALGKYGKGLFFGG